MTAVYKIYGCSFTVNQQTAMKVTQIAVWSITTQQLTLTQHNSPCCPVRSPFYMYQNDALVWGLLCYLCLQLLMLRQIHFTQILLSVIKWDNFWPTSSHPLARMAPGPWNFPSWPQNTSTRESFKPTPEKIFLSLRLAFFVLGRSQVISRPY